MDESYGVSGCDVLCCCLGWFVLTKGKPWSVEEELRLKELFESGVCISDIAREFGKSELAVIVKARRLGLVVVVARGRVLSTTSSGELRLPDDLPSIEEAARILGGAMLAMKAKGLTKFDLEKNKAVADVTWKYKELMIDLYDLRSLEKRIVALESRVDGLEVKGKGSRVEGLGEKG